MPGDFAACGRRPEAFRLWHREYSLLRSKGQKQLEKYFQVLLCQKSSGVNALENLRQNCLNGHQSGKPEQIGRHHDRQIKQLCNAGEAER